MSAWIPDRRQLTQEERNLLFFLTKAHPNLLEQLEGLKVIARCVCGCPTVAFGNSYEEEPVEGGGDFIAYHEGRAANGTLVGVHLIIDDGRMVELEGVGLDDEFVSWPPIDALVAGSMPQGDSRKVSSWSRMHFPMGQRAKFTTSQKAWILIMFLVGAASLLRLVSYFTVSPVW